MIIILFSANPPQCDEAPVWTGPGVVGNVDCPSDPPFSLETTCTYSCPSGKSGKKRYYVKGFEACLAAAALAF